jgi:methyl-accepting chemotaxis protein
MFDWLIRRIMYFLPKRMLGANAPGDGDFHGSKFSPHGLVRSIQKRNRKSRLSHHEARHLTSKLALCISDLKKICNRVESDFLSIGGRLQSIYTQATQMTGKVQSAIEQVGMDGDNSILSDIIRTANQALSDQRLEQSRMAQRMKNLRFMCGDLDNLRNMAGGLSQIAKALKMVAININIESVRTEESQDSFVVLSQEIRTLSDTVASLERTLFKEIQAITQKLESMQSVMDAKLTRFAQLAADARDVTDRAEPECRSLMDHSVKALKHVGLNGEVISRNTSHIVVSLQIHDNVSQRVEHITEALADSRLLIQQLVEKGPMFLDSLEPIAATDANLGLQQAQIATIIADIRQAFQKSGRSFHMIGDTVKDMSANILQIALGKTSCHSNDKDQTGSLGSLQAALEKIRFLIGQGDEAVEELKTIGRDATDAVSRIGGLMEQVRNVNFEIHLKSLNAIVKSAHLGDRGRAIAVLVQEMKDLATQSKELVEQIESTNTIIINRVDQLKEHLPAVSADGRNAMAVRSEDLDASIRKFSDSSSAFTQYADEMVQQHETLGALITAAEDQLVFLKPFAGQMQYLEQQLEACRNRLAPWVPSAGAGTTLDKTRLADRYTMQQEREIHMAVLNKASVRVDDRTTRAPQSEKQNSQNEIAQQDGCHTPQGESELGENVELF